MLAQRRRRCANISPALGQRLVLLHGAVLAVLSPVFRDLDWILVFPSGIPTNIFTIVPHSVFLSPEKFCFPRKYSAGSSPSSPKIRFFIWLFSLLFFYRQTFWLMLVIRWYFQHHQCQCNSSNSLFVIYIVIGMVIKKIHCKPSTQNICITFIQRQPN